MKYNHFLIISLVILLFSCKKKEDSFWDDICVSAKYQPFVFCFADSQNPVSGEIAQSTFNRVAINNKISDINSSSVNGLMMFPSASDALYNPFAEELKFLFDDNGDNSLNVWPSFFSNMKNYGIDTLAWQAAIKNELTQSPKVRIGIGLQFDNSRVGVFVKGEYVNSLSSEHRLAVYIYDKSQTADVSTLSGTKNVTLQKVFSTTPNATYGVSVANSATAGDTFQKELVADLNGKSASQIGVIAVLYEIKDDKPFSVLNSAIK